jgi:hypothetical protein
VSPHHHPRLHRAEQATDRQSDTAYFYRGAAGMDLRLLHPDGRLSTRRLVRTYAGADPPRIKVVTGR